MHEPTDENLFQFVVIDLEQWKYFKPDAQEMGPSHISEALGKYVVIKGCVDSNHAVNMPNMRSYYSIIIYVNTAPIICYIKFQNTVEASSF